MLPQTPNSVLAPDVALCPRRLRELDYYLAMFFVGCGGGFMLVVEATVMLARSAAKMN